LDANLAKTFATGLEATSNDLGTVFEETLLVYALLAAEAPLGIPHFAFQDPIESHEIDFAIYDTAGHPQDADSSCARDQGLCVWEVTCGHLVEAEQATDEGWAQQHAPGADHPRNKLVNFLALSSFGFARFRYHYVSILPSGEGVSAATTRALENTPGFSYWCLGAELGADIQDYVLRSLDAGIDDSLLRGWHGKLVAEVEQRARDFARLSPITT
jgi:hypothetical protein